MGQEEHKLIHSTSLKRKFALLLGQSGMTNKYAQRQPFTKEREQNYTHGAWHRREGEQFIMLLIKGGKSVHV